MADKRRRCMKVLIGYDGSEYSDYALDDLQRAGLPVEAEAIVLSVAEAWELPAIADQASTRGGRFVYPSMDAIRRHLADAGERAQTLADAARDSILLLFPRWRVTAISKCGTPAVELINQADARSPDLLVVGSQGRSAVGRFLLGSVSQKVLNEADCSVRISKRRETTPGAPLKVMIAVDGSANAEAVVREVAARSWKKDTIFRLVAVDDPFRRPETGYSMWNFAADQPDDTPESREWIDKTIKAPSRILESAGLNVKESILWGDAGNRILAAAEEWGSDVIFLGARGLGRVKRFLLGSVSSTVAARSHCSVELVRPKIAE